VEITQDPEKSNLRMVKIKELIEELQFLSDRISTQVRTISVSLIAFVWILLIGGDNAPFKFSLFERRQLLIIVFLALIAMLLDFLQYFFGYLYTNSLRKDLEESEKEKGEYDYCSWKYRLRIDMFWSKQIILMVAAVWLGIIIVWHLMIILK
jgi:hypothetical protein